MCSARVKEGRLRACVCNVAVAFAGGGGWEAQLVDPTLEPAKPRIAGLLAK